MGKFFKIILTLAGILYVVFDLESAYSSNVDVSETIRVVVYSIMINLLTHWMTDSKKIKEEERIIYERNLLHELLLKKDRISSSKIKSSIKKLDGNGTTKKRNKRKRR